MDLLGLPSMLSCAQYRLISVIQGEVYQGSVISGSRFVPVLHGQLTLPLKYVSLSRSQRV